MDTFMIKAAQLILALMILVTIHEFGHYIFARIFGIKVNRFYLFFNPWFSLLKYYPDKGEVQLIAWTEKKKVPHGAGANGEEEISRALLTFKAGKPHSPVNKKGRPSWAATLYGIGWLPLGGYCDIAGMVDETTSADKLSSEAQPWEFRSKPAWKRFFVMVAGVLFNFILAIVIYAGIAYHWGEEVVAYQEAYEGMDYAAPLHDEGFCDGDILWSVNGQRADALQTSTAWDMIQPGTKVTLVRNHIDTVNLTISDALLPKMIEANTAPMGYRMPVYVEDLTKGLPAIDAGIAVGDHIVRVAGEATPSLREFYTALEANKGQTVDITVDRGGKQLTMPVTLTDNGKIGIQLRTIDKIYPVERKAYTLWQSIPRGVELGVTQLTTYVSSLKLLFTKEGATQVGGFGALGGLFPVKWNWYAFWQITALLSVILAFMNILPIPALDGGYVLFLLWEIVTGHKVPDKYLEVANTIGFGILLVLLLWANGMDIFRALQ